MLCAPLPESNFKSLTLKMTAARTVFFLSVFISSLFFLPTALASKNGYHSFIQSNRL